MTETTKINYIELPCDDMAASKAFYTAAFGWDYVDYGPTYAAFAGAGIDGGLDANSDRKPSKDGALVILYAKDLEAVQTSVEQAGGKITVAIFAFPGGRRFHFTDPNGNELAVWSDPA
ncbi:Glyoxalase family protein [hydrothermal vent metagenome]|uniref:Glyoxalase family protein n=1 Tax=hydrothermal vent metagenome TaxID=652676 RepID=A0A3B0RSZ5_9ZZZZ